MKSTAHNQTATAKPVPKPAAPNGQAKPALTEEDLKKVTGGTALGRKAG